MGGVKSREMTPFSVVRVFLYGMATGLLVALVLCFIDGMLSHRLGLMVWGR